LVRLPFNWGRQGSSSDRRKSGESNQRNSVPHDFKNYYDILAVARNASTAQIEQAYGRMLQKYGPHVNISECDPDMQINMLRTINEAYKVLVNPSRRKMHDKELERYFGNEDVRGLSKKIAKDKSSQSQDN
jgi:DnaJ-class molecular chaperone